MQPSISRNARCPCGSGRRHKNCCGGLDNPNQHGSLWDQRAIGCIDLSAPNNKTLVAGEPVCHHAVSLPPGVYLRQTDRNAQFQSLVRQITARPLATYASIMYEGKSTQDNQRVTDLVDVAPLQDTLNQLVRYAFGELAQFFAKTMRGFETPQVLRYRQGGYYKPHSDADSWQADKQRWTRVLDRDLSLLIYLDDNYDGGELVFPNFDFRLRPRAGMIVGFPSDYRYLHGAMPVTRGIRHAIVSWGSVES